MQKYKNIGFKLTPQRIAILEYLDGNKEHPSAEKIYREVSKRFPTMSLATVYNTLDTLRQRGGVLELTIDPDKKRFDPNMDPHHHLICVRCRKIEDICSDYTISVPGSYREGFEILGNHIEFYGICTTCKPESSKGRQGKRGPHHILPSSRSKKGQ
jgi:Fur family peroxide stress response transcriptional regulator